MLSGIATARLSNLFHTLLLFGKHNNVLYVTVPCNASHRVPGFEVSGNALHDYEPNIGLFRYLISDIREAAGPDVRFRLAAAHVMFRKIRKQWYVFVKFLRQTHTFKVKVELSDIPLLSDINPSSSFWEHVGKYNPNQILFKSVHRSFLLTTQKWDGAVERLKITDKWEQLAKRQRITEEDEDAEQNTS